MPQPSSKFTWILSNSRRNQWAKPAKCPNRLEYLLNCDPNVKLQKHKGTESLLHDACHREYTDSNIHVQAFINGELVYSLYSRKAKDHRPSDEMTMDNSHCIQLFKFKAMSGVHHDTFAHCCQHHKSPSVIKYLVGLDATALDAVDQEGNTALHLACHCACHEIIALLLDEDDALNRVNTVPETLANAQPSIGIKSEYV
eukprot:scaffold653_cov132-Skeletonema_marinoi.AAC.2